MKVAFGAFTFDSETRLLLRDGRELHLSPKAFDLLLLLLERRPAVVTKAELLARIWPGTFVEDASLTVLVADIRRLLDDDSRAPAFVRTVHGRGYAFSGAVRDLGPDLDPRRPRGPGRCWLTWREQARPLAEGENIIGRDPACDVWIEARGVSRRHARILVLPGSATVEDLDSTNGTFLGGGRLASARPLEDGDTIGLGPETLTFRAWSDGPPATEPVARRAARTRTK
jgi:DNA-binding winged helix-turn-helix (wHTH) protein